MSYNTMKYLEHKHGDARAKATSLESGQALAAVCCREHSVYPRIYRLSLAGQSIFRRIESTGKFVQHEKLHGGIFADKTNLPALI